MQSDRYTRYTNGLAADAERYVTVGNRRIYEPAWVFDNGRIFELSKRFL